MKHLLPLLSLLLLFMTAYAQNDLPPNGAEIPLSMIALNTPLTIRSSRITVDFRGGLKQHVDVDPNDPDNSRRLRVVGFRMIAELPEGGTVTIEQNDVDEEAKSRLRVTQMSPLTYEHSLVLPFKMTIDAPENGSSQEQLILTTKDPMMLISTITQFPPKGDLYKIQNPVDLVVIDDPDKVVIATIQQFPVKIGGRS
jgi:hypothetical protein